MKVRKEKPHKIPARNAANKFVEKASRNIAAASPIKEKGMVYCFSFPANGPNTIPASIAPNPTSANKLLPAVASPMPFDKNKWVTLTATDI